MKLPLQIPAADDDSPEYLDIVRRTVHGLVGDSTPQDIWLVRVDNWFGKNWCAFVGKVLGAFGVARRDRLVVPPFVPARIEHVQYLRAVVGGFRSESSAPELHREQSSDANERRLIDEMTDDGLLVWYAGRSAKNRRASIMVYRVRSEEQWGWHIELQERSGRWRVSSVAGVSWAELAVWTGRSLRGLQKPPTSPEWPRTTSVELRAVVDAFRRRSGSIGYSSRWSCKHTERVERLDLDLQGHADVRLSFWANGRMWVRACCADEGAHAGWRLIWAFHGSWTDIKADQLVQLYKASSFHLQPTAQGEAGFLRAWAPVNPVLDAGVHREAGAAREA